MKASFELSERLSDALNTSHTRAIPAKLTPTGSTFVVLLAIVDTTVFDDFTRVTARAGQG
jgi:hypothetical protein